MTLSPSLSYEVFPPRTPQGERALASTIEKLNSIEPVMVSVTYGAGGADKERSFAAVDLAARYAECPVAAHLTCVGVPRAAVDEVVDRYLELGVRHIVALRGDPPEGIDAVYRTHPDGFDSTAQLVKAIRDRASAAGVEVMISVSAYPEVHPQSPHLAHDLDVLEAKVAAGANRAMTQMFFRTEAMRTYLAALRDRNISTPVIPGIMPVHDLARVTTFAERCGATIPDELKSHFAGTQDSHEAAVSWASQQIVELHAAGIDEFHLYTLNKPDLVIDIANRLKEIS